MAKRTDDILEKEATRIGYETMIAELQQLIDGGLSGPQAVAVTDQHGKIRERLEQLLGGGNGGVAS